MQNAYHPFAFASTFDAGHSGLFVGAVRRVDHDRSARDTCVRAADGPLRRLFVDARLLGIWRSGLLLGAGYVGAAALSWLALDSRLLGLGWGLRLAWRLLGSSRRILRWHQLRLRLRWLRL